MGRERGAAVIGWAMSPISLIKAHLSPSPVGTCAELTLLACVLANTYYNSFIDARAGNATGVFFFLERDQEE